MEDGYLETAQEEYERRKALWLKNKNNKKYGKKSSGIVTR